MDNAAMVDGMTAPPSPRLDRAGRILVRIGGLVAVLFVAVPAFVFALVVLGFADSSTTIEGQSFVAALMVLSVAVVATVAMMLDSSVFGPVAVVAVGVGVASCWAPSGTVVHDLRRIAGAGARSATTT